MTLRRVSLLPLAAVGLLGFLLLMLYNFMGHPAPPPELAWPDIDLMRMAQSSRKGLEFSSNTKRKCLKAAAGRDMVTGEALKPGYQFHHIQPIDQGGQPTLDNCMVVNLSTHNALHELMSNYEFSLRKYYKFEIPRLSPAGLQKVIQFLQGLGWVVERDYFISPWSKP